MKKSLILSVFIIATIYASKTVNAQTKSSKDIKKQQSTDTSEYSLRRKYKYLDIILKDEKNLLKIGYNPSIIGYNPSINGGSNVYITDHQFQFPIDIVFEKKIFPEWSLVSEFQLEFANSWYTNYYHKSRTYTFNLGTRYYYGMKKAIQKRNSGNNFNSHYFEFSINRIPPFSNSYSKYKDDSYTSNYTIKLKPTFNFAWGFQHRLNNYSFIDTKIFAGCQFQRRPIDPETYYIGLSFALGFGFNLKR